MGIDSFGPMTPAHALPLGSDSPKSPDGAEEVAARAAAAHRRAQHKATSRAGI